jgi:hypothetical protein
MDRIRNQEIINFLKQEKTVLLVTSEGMWEFSSKKVEKPKTNVHAVWVDEVVDSLKDIFKND